MKMTYLEYCQMLITLKKEAKDNGVSLVSHVNAEIKKYKHLVDDEKEKNDFYKRITANAGPRDQ